MDQVEAHLYTTTGHSQVVDQGPQFDKGLIQTQLHQTKHQELPQETLQKKSLSQDESALLKQQLMSLENGEKIPEQDLQRRPNQLQTHQQQNQELSKQQQQSVELTSASSSLQPDAAPSSHLAVTSSPDIHRHLESTLRKSQSASSWSSSPQSCGDSFTSKSMQNFKFKVLPGRILLFPLVVHILALL